MQTIQSPSSEIRSLLSTKQNQKALKEWTDLLLAPFKNGKYHSECFRLDTVLHEGSEVQELFDDDVDLVEIQFPTTIAGLYKGERYTEDATNVGYLRLSIENRAHIQLAADEYALKQETLTEIFKDDGIQGNMREIHGTWEEIAKVYFKYLDALMSVPNLPGE